MEDLKGGREVIRFKGENFRKIDEESRPCRELGETRDDVLV